MKFLLDEHIDPILSRLLEEDDHSVKQVREFSEGIEDEKVVQIAKKESSVIVTRDDDFLKLKDDHEKMPGILKVNGFPNPSTLKQNIMNEIRKIDSENMENTVLYV